MAQHACRRCRTGKKPKTSQLAGLQSSPYASAGGEDGCVIVYPDDQERAVGLVDNNGITDHVRRIGEHIKNLEEDGGPRDGVVDGEIEPVPATGEELETTVTAAKAPLIPGVPFLLDVRIDSRELLEEEIPVCGRRGQIGVTGAPHEEHVGGTAGEEHITAVG